MSDRERELAPRGRGGPRPSADHLTALSLTQYGVYLLHNYYVHNPDCTPYTNPIGASARTQTSGIHRDSHTIQSGRFGPSPVARLARLAPTSI